MTETTDGGHYHINVGFSHHTPETRVRIFAQSLKMCAIFPLESILESNSGLIWGTPYLQVCVHIEFLPKHGFITQLDSH